MSPCIAQVIEELIRSANRHERAGNTNHELALRAAAAHLNDLVNPPADGAAPKVIAKYCLGFAFNDGTVYEGPYRQVALIRKLKPEWQKGLLNGIGGKIEDGESGRAAMVREFHEETGWSSSPEDWTYFAQMRGEDFSVFCFASLWNINEIHSLKSMELEKVEIHYVSEVLNYKEPMVENLRWLIPLALDCLLSKDAAPHATVARY